MFESKTVLSAFGGDLGESLGDGSFSIQASVLGHVLEGCYYPEATPSAFVRGLVPAIRKVGGDVLSYLQEFNGSYSMTPTNERWEYNWKMEVNCLPNMA
jgi:hypothetical protein